MNPGEVRPARKKIDAAMARALLEQDRKQRASEAAAEIDQVLASHGCALATTMVVEIGPISIFLREGAIPGIRVAANPQVVPVEVEEKPE